MPEQHVSELMSHLFRTEAGKMTSVLTRIVGLQNIDLAEDIVQDTLLKAMGSWKIKGIPDNPHAWLYKVAKRKAIDAIREKNLHREIETSLAQAFRSEWTLAPAIQHYFFDHEIEDSQLRMMFVCCHPAIPYESQIALILKTLGGLSISEIANHFLTNEETIIKRLYRAREKIRAENIELEIPSSQKLVSGIETVLHTLYLLFNEGYCSSHPDEFIRHDLCQEAMRLCFLLTKNPLTNVSDARALLALMCYQASRSDARVHDDGSIVLLKYQNRKLWNYSLIEKGDQFLDSSTQGHKISEYHLEAAIAGCHARASSFETTDWKSILNLYNVLATIKLNPIVEMNRAIAMGYAVSIQAGVEKLKTIQGLEKNAIYHTALGDFYLDQSSASLALFCYETALQHTNSKKEKKLIQEKIKQCG